MKYLGIIGCPLGHSLSPFFQQAALDHLGLDIRYEAWETSPDRLAERVDRLRAPDHLGANVTIPHKEAVIPFLNELDNPARRTGAVNTIANRQGRLYGYNTDVAGFLRALREDAGFDPRGRDVLVLGAGGAARAVAAALLDSTAASLTITDIDPDRAASLVRDLGGQGQTVLRIVPPASADLAAAASACQLLVNCTPIGMRHNPAENDTPIPPEIIQPGVLTFDIVYNPPETVLMAAARQRGAHVLGGLSMLIYQGAASFQIWTGREAPVDVMFAAARRALGLPTTAIKGNED